MSETFKYESREAFYADFEVWDHEYDDPNAPIETAPTTGRTAADEYEGNNAEVRTFLSAFEV